MIPVTILFPLLSMLSSEKAAVLGAFTVLCSFQNIGMNFTFASGNVLVNQAALRPDLKDQVGAINGAGHMLSSAVRAVGPALAGSMWSFVAATSFPGVHFLPFLLCTVLAIAELKLYTLA
jgi:hypothetical protein